MEELKQKIAAAAHRLSRYKARSTQYAQNKKFQSDAKQFYRELRMKSPEDTIPAPSENDVMSFWKDIYENEISHNADAPWIRDIEDERIPTMQWDEITAEEVRKAVSKTQNWKAPGIDKIANFWLKYLPATADYLAQLYNNMITTGVTPEWLSAGHTYLLPKEGDSTKPKNYRPITCLNTMYKILTSILTMRINQHITEHGLLPQEQKGCTPRTLGCKDQLLISKAVVEDCKQNNKNLHQTWIDYQKAFDSVPHSWIIKSLELIHPPIILIRFLKQLMLNWKTKMTINTGNQTINIGEIAIRRGIYQGDSLSPLLFCIALAPLSKLLNKNHQGYKTKTSQHSVTHLLYMDDLKLMASSKGEMKKLLTVVKEFSDDIGMNFGLEKCASVSIVRGKIKENDGLKVDENKIIKSLEPGAYYKYLGTKEGDGIGHDIMKRTIAKEYNTRVRKILQTQLNSRNKIQAINTYAVPIMQYSFCIINWNQAEIQQLDRKTRKLLTIYKMLHPKADIDRLYVPRKRGGRGLLQLESALKSAITKVGLYIKSNAASDKIVKMIHDHEESKPLNFSITKRSAKILNEARLSMPEAQTLHQEVSINNHLRRHLEEKWLAKPLHGKLPKEMSRLQIDANLSYAWLQRSDLKGETESLLTAAQDQAIRTRSLEHRILKTRDEGQCRLCKNAEETITHIMSGCPILAQREYIERHNKVCSLIHYQLCIFYGCAVNAKAWYDHKPQPVTNSPDGSVTILFDQPIRTDRAVPANRPDIVVKDNQRALLIDVAIPSDANIITKEAEKNLKYRSLVIDIERMWQRKAHIIPIIIGCTGYVSKDFRTHVDNMPGHHSPEIIQKTAILGTSHIIRKVLK